MKLIFLNFIPGKEKWYEKLQETYLEKLQHYFPTENLSLKASGLSRNDRERALKDESIKVFEKLKSDDFLVLFDQDGHTMHSEKWALELNRILNSGKKRICFLIGGPFGCHPELKQRAQLIISLGPQVMNQMIASAVVYEQVYRSLTIINHQPYHNP